MARYVDHFDTDTDNFTDGWWEDPYVGDDHLWLASAREGVDVARADLIRNAALAGMSSPTSRTCTRANCSPRFPTSTCFWRALGWTEYRHRIGSTQSNAGKDVYTGLIDEMSIFSNSLTPDQVAALYSSAQTGGTGTH